MPKIELKICPFCGENDLKIHESIDRDFGGRPSYPLMTRWFVSCRGECFLVGPASSVSQEDAVRKWNNRPSVYSSAFTITGNKLDNLGYIYSVIRFEMEPDNEYRARILDSMRRKAARRGKQ